MPLAIDELDVATRKHFMPVITNQIFKLSPVLHRIFKFSKEGQWGLALPSYDGKSIVEPLEYGEVASTNEHGPYKKDTTWGAGEEKVLTAANFPWKINLKYVFLKSLLIQGMLKLQTLAKAILQYETRQKNFSCLCSGLL